MKFSQRMELRQSQSLVMTPQLLQAIKLLQLSGLELNDYVEAELEKNPLLERATDDTGPINASEAPAPDSSLGSDSDWESRTITPERGEIDPRVEVQLDNVYQDDAPPPTSAARQESDQNDQMGLSAPIWSGVGGQSYDGEDNNLEAYVAAEISLHDHLTEQLHVATTDPVDRMIGASLIDLVDEAGYLRDPLDEVADRLGVDLKRVQAVLSTPRFRCYWTDDVVGVEMGGAIKNVLAVAVGASDSLGYGANGRAALITRGLSEMTRLAVARGANPLTMGGLAGVGDLVLTCTGDLSRNRSVGLRIGRGEKLTDIMASMTAVAEGVLTSKSAAALADSLGVDVPIIKGIYRVLHQGADPEEVVASIMTRDLKNEVHPSVALATGRPSQQ